MSGSLPEFTDAVMLIVGEVLAQRDRARAAAGRAYQLADRWQAAHGSAMFLVRAAGAELHDELDGQEAGGIRGLLEHVGIDTASRDITVAGRVVDVANAPYSAAECSAQYHDNSYWLTRQCIRAAQHRGVHIDDRGFQWPDAVAVYPAVAGQLKCGRAEASSCSNPDHACKACGDCMYEHPGEGGCTDADQAPPNQSPLTGIEVRDPCPYCEGCPLIPRRQMIDHMTAQHPGAVQDFPLGWRVAMAYAFEEHNPQCSYAQTRGALLCDCHILFPAQRTETEA